MKAYFLRLIKLLIGLLCTSTLIVISVIQKDYSECMAWSLITIINILNFKK